MQNFQLMKNDLIAAIDKFAVKDRVPLYDLQNTLKTVKKVKPVPSDRSIYNSKMTFSIPRQYNNLAQAFIKCTLTTVGAALPKSELGTRIFKQIVLQTRNGTILQDIRPLYSLTRIDELTDSPTYNYVQNAIDPEGDFEDNSVTLFLPVFSFFSDSPNSFLATRLLEPLELLCYTNISKESMGLETDLTATSFELHLVYHDSPETKAFESKTGADLFYKDSLPSQLVNSYDVFYEDITPVLTGATTVRVLLRNYNPSYVMHMALVDPTTQSMQQIKSFKLIMAGEEVVDMDYRMNFSTYGNEVSVVDMSTLSYWFSKEKCRLSSSGLIEFSDSFFPTYLELTFDALGSEYDLNVFFEHLTNIQVSKTGTLTRQAVGYLKVS
jgi:hypothetical protein